MNTECATVSFFEFLFWFPRHVQMLYWGYIFDHPFVRTSFGSHSFSVAAPDIWNSLPLSLRTCTSPDTFSRYLKTHYCQQAFQFIQPLSSCASDSALLTTVRVYKLYLLTYLLISSVIYGRFPCKTTSNIIRVTVVLQSAECRRIGLGKQRWTVV